MSDHLVLFVDSLVRPAVPADPVAQPAQLPADPSPPPPPSDAAAGPSGSAPPADRDAESERGGDDEEEPLIQMAECRICQEEDGVANLETPCACSGSLKVID